MGVDFWLAGWLGWLGLAGWLAGWPGWGLAFGYGYRFLLLSVVPSTLKSNQYFQNPWLGLAWLGLAGWLARLGFSFLHGFRFLVLNGAPCIENTFRFPTPQDPSGPIYPSSG